MGDYISFGCKIVIKNVLPSELKIIQLINDYYTIDDEKYGDDFKIDETVATMLDGLTDKSRKFFEDRKWVYIFCSYDRGHFEKEYERKITINSNTIYFSIQSEVMNYSNTIQKFLDMVKQFEVSGEGKIQFENNDEPTILTLTNGSITELLPPEKDLWDLYI